MVRHPCLLVSSHSITLDCADNLVLGYLWSPKELCRSQKTCGGEGCFKVIKPPVDKSQGGGQRLST